ncbi:MAG TPA: MBL fold metallo-hydrolase [Firmicutes bacterium]|jgi:7,8-dihydropterin-6-yl-methyl-4-(beta-D-ribofuranosyl)aminobenzene 5'-phosphate synthase|nr:MBL fold metallo-hydrolase [Bacillota bacterium]
MISEAKVTSLCENSVSFPGVGIRGEHGVSMLLETGGKKILFDTGAGLTLVQNAFALKIDLTSIDAVVLSHGHYDHTGGLKKLLDITGPLPVYVHPAIFDKEFHLHESHGPEPMQIGIPWSKEEMEGFGAKFHISKTPTKIVDGVTITGEIPRTNNLEKGREGEFLRQNADGSFYEDILPDDQAIILETSLGTVALLGCAHAGLINTLRYANEVTGNSKVYACIGGTHLVDASAERLDFTLKELENFDLKKIAACHCTGFKAACILSQAFGDRFSTFAPGTMFKF